MNDLAITAIALSAIICWLACFLVRRWAPVWKLVDAPGGRKTHAAPTPLGGGLAIGLSVLLTLLLIGRFELSARLLIGAVAMLALGLSDDRWRVSWKLRLAIELLVAAWFVANSANLFPHSGDVRLLCAILAMLWIVVQLNAINMLDNMDGLAAGVAAIAAVFLALMVSNSSSESMGLPAAPPLESEIPDEPGAAIGRLGMLDALLPLTLFGALIGFLRHNRPPARLFMGDAGSYFVGFLLGAFSALAIALAAGEPWPAPLAPACVLLVPLYDMVSVVTIRLLAGRSPFAADRNHVSHRLVRLGLTQRQVVLALYIVTFAAGLVAVVVQRASPMLGMAMIAGLGMTAALAAAGEYFAHRRFSRCK